MGFGSPGQVGPHRGPSERTYVRVTCYPRIHSMDRGRFRTMRPWDSVDDCRAHCSAPYVGRRMIPDAFTTIMHRKNAGRFGHSEQNKSPVENHGADREPGEEPFVSSCQTAAMGAPVSWIRRLPSGHGVRSAVRPHRRSTADPATHGRHRSAAPPTPTATR